MKQKSIDWDLTVAGEFADDLLNACFQSPISQHSLEEVDR
jgi:hypothetical protein